MSIRNYLLSILLLLVSLCAEAQDPCSGALLLCGGSSRNSSTAGASAAGTDPALSCGDMVVNNSVWFTVLASKTGNCTITVTNINNNPGLDMEVYTGACGALVSTGSCASGSSATGGSMTTNFATTAGTTYFIMVDGNAGNAESFDIVATSLTDDIVARPDADFNPSTYEGCVPLSVVLDSATVVHGGTNLTFEWRIDGGAYIPASGSDSTIIFNAVQTHDVALRVCNQQCGCKISSQQIEAQDLSTVITYTPPVACIGTPIDFHGDATIINTIPAPDPGITSWDWDFGDPASGVNNTASGQDVTHAFTNTSNSYNVSLTVQGLCGPKTANLTVNLLPKPTVTITGASDICEGQDLNLGTTVTNANGSITYNWIGAGTFSCSNCPAATVSGLPVGGPYTMQVDIVDSLGCTADTSVDVNVNELPTVFAGGFMTVCPNDSAQLNATAMNGISPYSYQWNPSAGLNNDTIFDPYTFNTNNQTYCITVTDANGCVSLQDCIFIDQFPPPTIQSATLNLCASQTPLQNTFTVNGAGGGSLYEWGLSPDYALITGAAPDSSSIDATFPAATPGTYNFIALVTDGVTGCIDTVPTSFTVTAGLSMSVTGPATLCLGDSATLSVTSADSYVWSAMPAYAFVDSTDSVQVVSPPATTTFTITGTQGTCTQTITHDITVGAKPVAFINPISPVCGCGSAALNGVGSTPGMNYSWTSQNGSTILAPGNMVTSATVCINDSIMLVVTDPATSCFSSDTESVISRLKPNATANVTPPLICNGVATAIVLDGTGSDTAMTYNWTSNTGALIFDTTQMVTSSNVSTATIFSLTVTDGYGCDSTASDTVNIYPPPSISANPPFLCTSDPVLQSTITISGAAPGSTYNWTTIPGCVTPSTANTDTQLFDFATCGTGVFTFDVTVTDAVNTCITNLSQDVNVVSGVTLTVTTDTICEGDSATLVVAGANSYLWSNGATTDTVVIGGLTAANSPDTLYVTGTIGSCVATDTVIVIINPTPNTAIVQADSVVCEGETVTYSVTPGGANYDWNITGGVILVGAGTSDVIVTWNTSGVGLLTVIETNASNCQGPLITINVLINPIPAAPAVTGPDTVCSDELAIYFVTPNAGSTYTWGVNGGSFVTGSTGAVNTFQWGPSGNGSLDVFETSAAGCVSASTNYPVTINPRPTPVFVTGNQSVCDNFSEIYTVAANAGSTYSWTVVNDLQDILNATTDTLTVNWNSGSSFGFIDVFETNSFGCNSDSTHLNISISIHPQAFIPNDSDTICNNVPYQIIANINASHIQWTTDGAGSFNNDTIAQPIYQPVAADAGWIHFTMVASAPPCPDTTATFSLYLNPSPVVSITGPPGPICYGTLTSLTATGGGTYIWTPGGIPSAVIGVRPLTTTTYTVAVTNALNCTTFDSIRVDVIPPGIPDAGPDLSLCAGDSIMLTGTQQNATGLIWSTLGDGTFSPDLVSSSVYYNPGVADTVAGMASVILTTSGACLNLSDTLNIAVLYHSAINAGNDTTLRSGSDVSVTVPLQPTTINVAGVLWTTSGTGTFSPSDTSVNAVYTPSEADLALDSVLLTVTTINSCTPVSDYLVIDFSPVIIPNIFTPYPASPGYNDYFVIQYITPHTELKVWDRWGHLVYTSSYYQNDWDAYGLQADVYYYLVVTEDRKYKGWVQVLR